MDCFNNRDASTIKDHQQEIGLVYIMIKDTTYEHIFPSKSIASQVLCTNRVSANYVSSNISAMSQMINGMNEQMNEFNTETKKDKNACCLTINGSQWLQIME